MGETEVHGYGSTHTGGRPDNQDWFVMDRNLGLYIVADGMGGRAGGEVASRLSTQVVQGFFKLAGTDSDLGFDSASSSVQSLAEARMDMAMRLAHREVCRRQLGELGAMGSTLAVLLIRHGRALIAHVGDSRVYRFRSGAFEQMTADHSFYTEMVASGVQNLPERREYRFGNLITRAVGMQGAFTPEISSGQVERGDRYLLCSDGLTDAVDVEVIETVLRQLPAAQVPPMLVATALSCGARDNVTVVVVEASAEKKHTRPQ